MKAEWESSKLAHEATRAEFESYKVRYYFVCATFEKKKKNFEAVCTYRLDKLFRCLTNAGPVSSPDLHPPHLPTLPLFGRRGEVRCPLYVKFTLLWCLLHWLNAN